MFLVRAGKHSRSCGRRVGPSGLLRSAHGARGVWQYVTICFFALIFCVARAQGSWQLPVCVDPSDPPASSQTSGGYEEQIARILAGALGAQPKMIWAPRGDRALREQLYPGGCDVIMGAPESSGQLLNTVPYYRAAFVFVWRSGHSMSVTSFTDPALKRLKIAIPPNALAAAALHEAGLDANAIPAARDYSSGGGAESVAPLIEAVRQGYADTAIVYGPYASAYIREKSYDLEVSPAPEITAGGLSMFRMATIGVRPGDEALRRRLNLAIAEKWDAIQTVLKDADVPLFPVSRPVASPSPETPPLQVGVVLPIPTPLPTVTDVGAKGAQTGTSIGAAMAGDALSKQDNRDLKIRLASAPSADAAKRAARRLVLTDQVAALVGGIGDGQAEALAGVAEQLHVPFVNIGGEAASFANGCQEYEFDLAASPAMYLDALAIWAAKRGEEKWFVVHAASDEGSSLLERTRAALAKHGKSAAVVGDAAVDPDTSVFYNTIDQLKATSPDLLVLLIPIEQQELLLSELPTKGFDIPVTGLLPAYAQDRSYVLRFREDNAAVASNGYWLASWDPALTIKASSSFNSAYASMTGSASDATAWAGFAAVEILEQASHATHSVNPEDLSSYLSNGGNTFDVGKGMPVSFRSWSHQLRQPLYVVKINPDAQWGPNPEAQAGLAQVVATLPVIGANVNESLDVLGDGRNTPSCQ